METSVVRLQRCSEAVLRHEELHEGADPLPERPARFGRVPELLGQGGALVDLVAISAYLLETLAVDTNAWSTFSDEVTSDRTASLTHKG